MQEFKNLPGIYVLKSDGNLTVLENIPGNVTLVIGTAPDGPHDSVIVSTDLQQVVSTYDPSLLKTGTLVRGVFEAAEKGAEYVAALRIGATPAKLDFLDGFTIVTPNANASAGAEYSIAYNGTTGQLQVINSETGVIVFDNGTDAVDNGEVLVYGESGLTASITLGTIDSVYVPLNDASAEVTVASPAATATAVSGNKYFTMSAAYTGFKPGMKVSIATPTATVKYVDYVDYKSDPEKPKVYVTTAFEANISEPTAVTGKATFYDAVTGVNISEIQKYEALEKAYQMLETAKIDMVIVKDIYVDTPNLVNNEGADVVPMADQTKYLGKAYRHDHNGTFFYTWDMGDGDYVYPSPYEMGIDGDAAVNIKAGKDIAGVDLTFYEVNFAHQLAEYLFGLSVNDNEAIGVVAMRPPSRRSNTALKYQWLGKEPVYNIKGEVTVAGTGLLGNKFIVGSVNVKPGFFHTTNRMVGGQKELFDKNNIDIGRYLSITAMPVMNKSAYTNVSTGEYISAEAIYGGLIMSLAENVSPLNKRFDAGVTLPFRFTKADLDALTKFGYVTFTVEDGYTKVVDAPTASLRTSDFNRLTTMRIVNAVVESARKVAGPFLGSVFNGEILNSLEVAENSMIADFINLNYLNSGTVSVAATKAQAVKGEAIMKIELETAPELRRIIAYVRLK